MKHDPLIELSRLRGIGWREWDPIGICPSDGCWNKESFADEYDTYLLKVAVDLRRGASIDDAIQYLLKIEREHMGVGHQPDQKARAEATVRSIQRYLAELDQQILDRA